MEGILHQMKGVVVLDSEGKRLFSKYFGVLEGDLEKQKKLELELYTKTPKTSTYYAENYCGVVKSVIDLLFYVVGDTNDNELLLSEVLDAVTDSLDILFGSQLEKRTLLENFDLLILTVDEIFEEGIILELDSTVIATKVADGESNEGKKDTLTSFFSSATESIKNSFFSF